MHFKIIWFLSLSSSHRGHTWGWKGEKKIRALIESSVSKPRFWAQVHESDNAEQAEAEGVHGGNALAAGEAGGQSKQFF